MSVPDDVTQILKNWSDGDSSALEKLMPLVYEELRRLARSYLARERADHTLQATALVHEAYLRLADQTQLDWKDRALLWNRCADDAPDSSRSCSRP
jgi:DNA-directed RNA polymerase specialized sigma24 family protein